MITIEEEEIQLRRTDKYFLEEKVTIMTPEERDKNVFDVMLENPEFDEHKDLINGMKSASLGIKESIGKLDYDLDWSFIRAIANRMYENRDKYPKGNWKKDIDEERLKEALSRHFVNYMIDDDNEDHLIAIVCNCMMLFNQRNK